LQIAAQIMRAASAQRQREKPHRRAAQPQRLTGRAPGYYSRFQRYYSMKVTSKGQVTIPKRIRKFLGVEAGAEVDFAVSNGEVVVRKAGNKRKRKSRFELMRGAATAPLAGTTDEIMAILRGEPWPPSEP
jgi:AbrB family looped-hinge helix DNA binding protein